MNYPSSRNTYELESKLYNQEYIPYNSSRNVSNKINSQRLSNSPPIILYKTENSKTLNNTHKYLFYPSISRLSPFTDGVTNYNIIENSNPRNNDENNNSNSQLLINEQNFMKKNQNSDFINQLGLADSNNNNGRKNNYRSLSLGNNRNNRNNGNNRDNEKYQLMLDKSLEVLKTLTENMPEADAKIIGNSAYYIDKDKDYDAIVDKLKKYISFNFKKNSSGENNNSKDGNDFNKTIGLNRTNWDKKNNNVYDNNNNNSNPHDNYYNNINNNNPNENYNNIDNNNPNENYNNINDNRNPNDNFNNINNNRSPNDNYGKSTGNINSGNNFIKRNNDDDNNNEIYPENEYINENNQKYGDTNDINYNPHNKKYNKTTNDEEFGNNFSNNNNFNNNRGISTSPYLLNNGKGDNDNNNNRNYINDYNNSKNNIKDDNIPTISVKKSILYMNDNNSHDNSQSNINDPNNPLIGTKNILDKNDNINNGNDDYSQQLQNDFTRQKGFGKNENLPNNSNVRDGNKNNLDMEDKNTINLNNTRKYNNNDPNIINIDNNKDNLNIDSIKGKTNFNPNMSDLSTKDHFNTNAILKARKQNNINQPLSQTSQIQRPNISNSQTMQGNIIDNKFPATNKESDGINNNKTSNNINKNIDNNLEDNKDNEYNYELFDEKKKQILSEYGKPFIGEEVKEQYDKDNKKYVITKSGANIKLSVLHGIEGEPLVHSGFPLLGKKNRFYLDKSGKPILLDNGNYIEGDKPISVTIKKGTIPNNEFDNINKEMLDSFGFNTANNIAFPNTVNTLRLDDNIDLGRTYQSNNFYNIGIGGGGTSELKKSRVYKNRIKMFPKGEGDAKPPIRKKIKRKLKK